MEVDKSLFDFGEKPSIKLFRDKTEEELKGTAMDPDWSPRDN